MGKNFAPVAIFRGTRPFFELSNLVGVRRAFALAALFRRIEVDNSVLQNLLVLNPSGPLGFEGALKFDILGR